MRILNIIQCANLGGMEQANLQRLLGLRAAGHEIALISLNPLGALGAVLARHDIPARGLNYRGRGGWRSVRALRRVLTATPADALLMTGHNLLAILALGDICRAHRVLALHYHHTGVKPAWQWRLIYRAALHRFKAITFPSDFVRREAEQLFRPIAAISHTVRDPMVLPQPGDPAARMRARQALRLPLDAKIIGNVGWLIPRKRLDVFLHVAQRVLAEEPRGMCVIAGDGPERSNLTRLAAQLGIAERVVWLGWQNDTTTVYRSLDAMLFNSDWDALGRAPLEALGQGVPLVASVCHGGLDEIVLSPAHGLLLNRHDIPVLASAVLRALREPGQARAEALAARASLLRTTRRAHDAETVQRLLALN